MDAVAENGTAEKPIQTFESCLEELEKVVKELESGDLDRVTTSEVLVATNGSLTEVEQ